MSLTYTNYNWSLPALNWHYISKITSQVGVDVLSAIDATGGVMPPASQHASTSWASGSANGGTMGIVTDTDFRSGKAFQGTYLAAATGIDAYLQLNMSGLALDELYIQFKAKMSGTAGACKFLKIFGTAVSTNYANFTLQPTWSSAGNIESAQFGDGTTITNDANNSINLDGTTLSNAGRSYPSTAVISTPQAADFLDWSGVNQFRVRVKFNTGTTSGNEVADGEIWVEINGNVYLNATGLFNRHYSNDTINRCAFFEYSQSNAAALTLLMSDIIVSTGGFA